MKIRWLRLADKILLECKLLPLTLTFKNSKIRKVKLVSLKKVALLIHSISETLLLKLQNSRTNYWALAKSLVIGINKTSNKISLTIRVPDTPSTLLKVSNQLHWWRMIWWSQNNSVASLIKTATSSKLVVAN